MLVSKRDNSRFKGLNSHWTHYSSFKDFKTEEGKEKQLVLTTLWKLLGCRRCCWAPSSCWVKTGPSVARPLSSQDTSRVLGSCSAQVRTRKFWLLSITPQAKDWGTRKCPWVGPASLEHKSGASTCPEGRGAECSGAGLAQAPPLRHALRLRPGPGAVRIRVRVAQAGSGFSERPLAAVLRRARALLFQAQLQQGPAVHDLQLLQPGPQRPGAARLVVGASASRLAVGGGLVRASEGGVRGVALVGVVVPGRQPQSLAEEAAVLALQPPVLQAQAGVLLAQPRVLPVPLVARAHGLQVAGGQVGEALLQLSPGTARAASPAHTAAAAAATALTA